MSQVIVCLNETHTLQFDSPNPIARDVKIQLEILESIPWNNISLSCDGITIEDEQYIFSDDYQAHFDDVVLRASIRSGLCGGKGGFGAQLRALARQKAARKTVDFGACRDLSGRRLRHVNDDVLLAKWKEAKDRGETFEVDDETPTGIDLWYLSVPSWAEGISIDKRKKFMKPRLKTIMCIDWQRAREHRAAPEGAPAHWGCPRGRKCEFAHGMAELRGDAQTSMKEQQEQQKRDEQNRKKDAYMGVVHRAAKEEEEVNDLVMAGLRAAKRTKVVQQEQHQVPKTSKSDMNEAQEEQEVSVLVARDGTSADTAAEVADSVMGYLSILSGNVVVARAKDDDADDGNEDHRKPVITGVSEFATIGVDIDQCASAEVEVDDDVARVRRYYYEVELKSDGLMQIGWVAHQFTPSSSSSNTQNAVEEGKEKEDKQVKVEADGVGDDVYSWALDGYRQMKWHAGTGEAYGPQTGTIWKAGDVVGCLLEIQKSPASTTTSSTDTKRTEKGEQGNKRGKGKKRSRGSSTTAPDDKVDADTAAAFTPDCQWDVTITYSVNGVDYGAAFQFPYFDNSTSSSINSGSGGAQNDAHLLYPALSLEANETISLNLGNAPFKFAPRSRLDAAAGVSSSSSSVTTSASITTGVSCIATNEEETVAGAVMPFYRVFSSTSKSSKSSKSSSSSSSNRSSGDSSKGDVGSSKPIGATTTTTTGEGEVSTTSKLTDIATTVTNTTTTMESNPSGSTVTFSDIDLDSDQYSNVATLEQLGLQHLKYLLEIRHLKTGGTLQERALRMHSIRGVAPDKIDFKLRAAAPRKKHVA